jgi:phosphonate transport system ATP-binding protein
VLGQLLLCYFTRPSPEIHVLSTKQPHCGENGQTMIELRDVSVIYANGQSALRDCSLRFFRGQFTILLGPSGAGKTTLLRCLNLLAQPTSGTVWTEDLGPLKHSRHLRAHRLRTGMIFQHHHLIDRHTAFQNVLMGRLGYHGVWRTLFPAPRREQRIALECLDRVELLHKALERAENLSGGERQRVGIARALAQRPRLILADEPVASLDPNTSHMILKLLHRISKEDHLTTVVSLHQVDLARIYADRIVGLNQGRVVFDGPPDHLLPEILATIYTKSPRDPDEDIASNDRADCSDTPLIPGND